MREVGPYSAKIDIFICLWYFAVKAKYVLLRMYISVITARVTATSCRWYLCMVWELQYHAGHCLGWWYFWNSGWWLTQLQTKHSASFPPTIPIVITTPETPCTLKSCKHALCLFTKWGLVVGSDDYKQTFLLVEDGTVIYWGGLPSGIERPPASRPLPCKCR